MSRIVKGIYRNGQVRLLETPEGVEEAEVVVTFPDDARWWPFHRGHPETR